MCHRVSRTVNSLVSMCSSFVTRAIEEFVLARTVWFLVSVFSPLPLPSCVGLSPLFSTFTLAFLPFTTFTVQGVNIHRHDV